ncbi:endonuclease/exonuclease/phosphatase family protein [Georgenia sp. SYP-B2076]|uniref:endonuclease/exonuclease/phosphatase family protein n=1 Tax=Georgenia sp. SYP-B2076 TaxID=2495881 RepID=UPI000F8CB031|nr:endonuclease/exonuclease/phosphatase family protein [Georgenia sp. SYP-B2076]
MRVISWFFVVVLGAAAALTVNPEWLGRLRPDWAGLTMTYPVSQAIAVRPLLVGIFAVVALVLLGVGLLGAVRLGRGGPALALGTIFLLVAGGHAWIPWDRGLDNPGRLSADDGVRAAGSGTGAITVLAYNTLGGRTGAEDIAALADENGVDVMMLAETSRATADRVAELRAADGETFQVFDAEAGRPGIGSTALLVATTLGEYVQTSAPRTTEGSVRAEPASGVGPVLVAVHPRAPVESLTRDWRRDLGEVTALCRGRGTDGLILAGDFNATLDHAAMADLGRCADAAVAAGAGGVSTWPVRAPEWLGTTIDHVLVDPRRYRATQAAVVERGDSDHRALLVRLMPR